MRAADMEDPLYLTDRNQKLLSLEGLYSGLAGFLVCAGPSLKLLPVEQLAERGIYSLGVNNVAGHAPCEAFVFSDPPQKFHHGIFLDPCVTVFSPIPKLKKHIRIKHSDGSFEESRLRVRECPAVFGFKRNSEFTPETFLTSDMASWGNNQAGATKTGRPKTVSTMLLGLRLLHYLGFRRVYMLGVDLCMQQEGDKYAFKQGKEPGGVQGNMNAYKVINGMLTDLRPVFDAAGFEVFNCNPKSGCSAFDHVPFEAAIEDCRGPVPKEPFDLEDWYDWNRKKKKRDRQKKREPSVN